MVLFVAYLYSYNSMLPHYFVINIHVLGLNIKYGVRLLCTINFLWSAMNAQKQ